jgi:hypothetical protein
MGALGVPHKKEENEERVYFPFTRKEGKKGVRAFWAVE